MFLEGHMCPVWTDAWATPSVSLASAATLRFHRMLGYSTVFLGSMPRMNRHLYARNFSALRLFFLTALFSSLFSSPALAARPQQIRLPSGKGGIATLSSPGPHRRQGHLYLSPPALDIT